MKLKGNENRTGGENERRRQPRCVLCLHDMTFFGKTTEEEEESLSRDG